MKINLFNERKKFTGGKQKFPLIVRKKRKQKLSSKLEQYFNELAEINLVSLVQF